MAMIVIGVADMKLSDQPQDVLVTHALGSCLGISLYDPLARIGGIFHVMLPSSRFAAETKSVNPMMYVDTGTPLFFEEAFRRGAQKGRLIVKVAGGATADPEKDFLAIGRRNMVMLRKILWKNNILIAKEDVGGQISRSLYLDMDRGRTWLHSQGQDWEL